MRKFMKYEIKGSYRFILGIILILIIASTIVQFNLSQQMKFEHSGYNTGMGIGGFGIFMLVISLFVIFGGFLTAFFYIVGSFRKELYEDRGYLTFILPLTGNKILGAKFMVAILWFIVLGLSIFLYNTLLGLILFGVKWREIVEGFKMIYSSINSLVMVIFILSTLTSIATLILIYFSMALSRVSVRNKKVGGLWFVIFLIIQGIANYLTYIVSKPLPYYLDLKTFKIFHGIELGMMTITENHGYVNIFSILLTILISVGAFLTTGYIIEKKIDL